ncbi:hypothetical protein GW17_00030699, partial [Ensete ventricosum]
MWGHAPHGKMGEGSRVTCRRRPPRRSRGRGLHHAPDGDWLPLSWAYSTWRDMERQFHRTTHSRHHGKELSALADGKRDGRLISVPFPPVTNGRFHGLCVRQLDPLPDKEHPYGPHVTFALPHHPHVPTGVWAPRIVHHFATPPQRASLQTLFPHARCV